MIIYELQFEPPHSLLNSKRFNTTSVLDNLQKKFLNNTFSENQPYIIFRLFISSQLKKLLLFMTPVRTIK